MKPKTFRKQWLVVWLLALAAGAWIAVGRSWFRRSVIAAPPIKAAERVDDRFLALIFPRITPRARKYAMSRAELSDLLAALKKKGYVSIGLEDVRELYARRRLLPRKAVLLAFSGDDARGIVLADRALKKLRLRGNAFITRTAPLTGADRRSFMTRHAVAQMRAGGAWEFGWISQEKLDIVPELAALSALLDDGERARPKAGVYPLRFALSDLALNDSEDDPGDLRIMPVRAERLRELNVRIVENSWPRRAEVSDEFLGKELDPDWIPGWGINSKGGGRLTLLPLPRQTGAGIFLRGTDKWRDLVLEFDLSRHRKEFWAYTRYRGESGYLRVGVHDGYWYVEQKIGPKNLPTLLGRAPLVEDGRPARVRVVLKDNFAIVHVNGRMQFGRSLRVHPRVTRGRVLFGVYDQRTPSALAVLTRVRVRPGKDEWIAFKDGGARVGFDERRLDELREQAVLARAISPRWLAVRQDGGVAISREQETLIRSLAGFYGCRLVPMAEFPSAGAAMLASPSVAARLLKGLGAAARELDATGVNLRLRGTDLARPEMVSFLATLRSEFRAAGRQIWVTIDGPARLGAEPLPVDGVLRPAESERAGFELLEAHSAWASKSFAKEFASIP